jgi:hypothetical protein
MSEQSPGTNEELDPWDEALLDALGAAGGDDLQTLEEFSSASGISLPLLEALNREGFLMPRSVDPEPLFDPAEAETVRSGLSLVKAGLPLGELLDLARAMDEAMRPVAARAVDVFARFVRDSVEASAGSEADAAEQLVDAFRTMLPATGRLVEHHFRALLIADARRRLGA